MNNIYTKISSQIFRSSFCLSSGDEYLLIINNIIGRIIKNIIGKIMKNIIGTIIKNN